MTGSTHKPYPHTGKGSVSIHVLTWQKAISPGTHLLSELASLCCQEALLPGLYHSGFSLKTQ